MLSGEVNLFAVTSRRVLVWDSVLGKELKELTRLKWLLLQRQGESILRKTELSSSLSSA